MTSPEGYAWLFCPADRLDRYPKALDRADVVILDLEDAVPEERKSAARQNLLRAPLNPQRVVVRINAMDTEEHDRDLAAIRQTAITHVMLPKAEQPEGLKTLEDFRVIALCETAKGVLEAPRLARHPAVCGLMWGAEDLVVSTGGRASRDSAGQYYDLARTARSQVLLAARAAGVLALDAVYVDTQDMDGLRAEAIEAAASGFTGKACIHPDQVQVIRDAFRPDSEQVAWASRVLAACSTGGVIKVDGQMVDGPLIQQAQRIIAAHEERPSPSLTGK